jgi:hypothetical protein
MTQDSAAPPQDAPSDLGPVVELDSTSGDWGDYYAGPPQGETDETEWNDPEGTWVLDIGKSAGTPEAARNAVYKEWDAFRRRMVSHHFDEDSLLDGIEKVFSTSKTAEFFGRSTQWVYWGLRPDRRTGEQPFTFKDGTPIEPEKVGNMGKRRFVVTGVAPSPRRSWRLSWPKSC